MWGSGELLFIKGKGDIIPKVADKNTPCPSCIKGYVPITKECTHGEYVCDLLKLKETNGCPRIETCINGKVPKGTTDEIKEAMEVLND